jgi:predicted glycosyltransferase
LRPRLLLHVQHLLGTGHLRRMAAIAEALAARGARTLLVSGGEPVAGLRLGAADFVQLPPARAADTRFKSLVTPDGQAVDAAWKSARVEALLRLEAQFAPDLVLIEHFPFGRRLLEFELLPLIAATRAASRPTRVVSSVRDILVQKPDPARRAAMVARAASLFDHVLFHGDPRLIALTATLPEAAALGERLVATGYVAIAQAEPELAPGSGAIAPGEDEIVVSAGGGGVGRRLLDCALAARTLSRHRHRTWRILSAQTGLAARIEPGLVVEPNRPDFPTLLARAMLSVSQAGYNTVVDLLAARTRAVLVPFDQDGESEQTVRAHALAARGLATTLREATLSPDMLAHAIDRAAALARPTHDIDLGGAASSAELLIGWSRR